jgi:hypothetical protein
MANDWGSDDARPDADQDDITKYDHLLPLGSSRVQEFGEQMRRRDARIAELKAVKRRLITANIELNEELTSLKSWRWLDSTYDLQRRVYSHVLPMPQNTNELADYVQMNALAAVDEIMEMLGEVGWKPWANPRGWIRREHFMKEAVDALHFIANMLCAAGISDDELWEAYRAKQATNSRRQELGYDGVSGKCPGCRRSYDDGIDCAPASDKDSESSHAFCVIEDMFIDPEE